MKHLKEVFETYPTFIPSIILEGHPVCISLTNNMTNILSTQTETNERRDWLTLIHYFSQNIMSQNMLIELRASLY